MDIQSTTYNMVLYRHQTGSHKMMLLV